MNFFFRTICALGSLAILPHTHAIDYTVSGYVSLYAGKITGGEHSNYAPRGAEIFNAEVLNCPCSIADYSNAGVYQNDGWDFEPDSRAGLQLLTNFTNDLSFTLQGGWNGSESDKLKLDWAYLSWDLSEKFTVDIGRKAIPLFFYSDFLDVGYAYPWVRVPGAIYGWPLTSYNGVSASYTNDVGSGAISISAWYGEERDSESRQYEKFYYGVPVSIEWSDMKGISAEYSYEWFTARTVYMQSTMELEIDFGNGLPIVGNNGVTQKFKGLAVNMNPGLFEIRTEIYEFTMPETGFVSQGELISVGYHINGFNIGTITPTLSISHGIGKTKSHGKTETTNYSATIRWDFIKATSLKIQYDKFVDDSVWKDGFKYIGDSGLVTMGIDYVF